MKVVRAKPWKILEKRFEKHRSKPCFSCKIRESYTSKYTADWFISKYVVRDNIWVMIHNTKQTKTEAVINVWEHCLYKYFIVWLIIQMYVTVAADVDIRAKQGRVTLRSIVYITNGCQLDEARALAGEHRLHICGASSTLVCVLYTAIC